MNETFFTTIGCMDGRVQEPVMQYGKERFSAQYPDTITRAGLDGELPKRRDDRYLYESLSKKLEITIEKHNSKGIVVHGHADCAGNPVSEEEHKRNVMMSVRIIKNLIKEVIPVVGVFVKRSSENPNKWIVEEISEDDFL